MTDGGGIVPTPSDWPTLAEQIVEWVQDERASNREVAHAVVRDEGFRYGYTLGFAHGRAALLSAMRHAASHSPAVKAAMESLDVHAGEVPIILIQFFDKVLKAEGWSPWTKGIANGFPYSDPPSFQYECCGTGPLGLCNPPCRHTGAWLCDFPSINASRKDPA